MALRRVAELVNRAAQDTGILEALKHDPAKLRSVLNLSSLHLDALNSATALPLPRTAAKAAESANLKAARLASAAGKSSAALPTQAHAEVATLAGGGSLLPPEGSGVFTGGTGFAEPPSSPASPQAPSAPQAPVAPRAPTAPAKPPIPVPQAPAAPRPPIPVPQTPAAPRT